MDRELSPSDVLRLRPGLQIVSIRGTLYAVRATAVHYLGSGHADDYKALLSAVDGRRSVAEICATLDGSFDAESVREVLADLVGRVLEPVVAGGSSSSWPTELETLVDQELLGRPILVLGGGAIAESVHRRASGLGFSALTCIAPLAVESAVEGVETDVLAGDRTAPPVPTGGMDAEVVDVLARDRLEAAVSAHEVVLCCLEGMPYDAILAVNVACLAADTACVFLVSDTDGILIGPTVRPWRTPCFECSARQLLFEPEQRHDSELLRFAFAHTVGDRAAHSHVLDSAAYQAMREVVGLLSGEPRPRLHTRRLRIAPSGLRSEQRFGPNTECTSCWGMNRQGIKSASDTAQLPPGTPAWGRRDAVDRVFGTRSHSVQEARRRAEAALEALAIEVHVNNVGVPEWIARAYPPLAGLHCAFFDGVQRTPMDREVAVRLLTHGPAMGKGPNPEQAWCSAAYEWFERSLCHYHGGVDVYRASYDEVKDCAIDMHQLSAGLIPHYDCPQEPPFAPETEIDWVVGHSMRRDRTLLVPAGVAYFHRGRFRGGELALPRRSSSGLASGCELEDAVLQGLLEVVEHDAWFAAQITGALCPTIELDSVSDAISSDVIDSMQRAGFDVQVRNLTNDLGIPVFEVNLTPRDSYAQFLTSGWGCHLDPTIALRRALCEAVQGLCGHRQEDRNVVFGPTSILRTFNERAQRVSRVGRSHGMDELSGVARDTSSALACLNQCVESIVSAIPDTDVVFCDLTPVRGLGIHVTNTLVPGLTDAVDSSLHITQRLLNYRRIIEGDDAPVLRIEELYLGKRMH